MSVASVSNDLPRTSYIKMVDVWLVFNLFIPFLEVLLHTYKVDILLVSDYVYTNMAMMHTLTYKVDTLLVSDFVQILRQQCCTRTR